MDNKQLQFNVIQAALILAPRQGDREATLCDSECFCFCVA